MILVVVTSRQGEEKEGGRCRRGRVFGQACGKLLCKEEEETSVKTARCGEDARRLEQGAHGNQAGPDA